LLAAHSIQDLFNLLKTKEFVVVCGKTWSRCGRRVADPGSKVIKKRGVFLGLSEHQLAIPIFCGRVLPMVADSVGVLDWSGNSIKFDDGQPWNLIFSSAVKNTEDRRATVQLYELKWTFFLGVSAGMSRNVANVLR
jgi:hypothetical protein